MSVQSMWPTCPCVSRLSGGVATSESPIPTSRLRLTTQASQDIFSSVDPALQSSVAPTLKVN